MKQPVALFDFDNTIAQGDTIVRLLQYDIKKHPWHIVYFFQTGFYYLGYLLKISSFEKAKSCLLFPLKYMDDKQCEYFYRNHVEKYYYPHVVEELKEKKKQGYFVVVCTASCETYMKYCRLPIDAMIGTRYKDGQIIGKNCKGKEKIPRILSCLESSHIDIDKDMSFGYSDSDSDIPMLSLVKHKKRVLLKTGKIVDFE